DAVDTVFIEDLTWMEVRDAMRAGKDTVIVATGGVEQNGPYLVTGKHNVVLRGATERIARKLGNTLVAPIVPFVPEGDIDPPSLHALRQVSQLSVAPTQRDLRAPPGSIPRPLLPRFPGDTPVGWDAGCKQNQSTLRMEGGA
ncbi:MAG: creatininase family protein, partial [Pirellulaceae bacterium]|nr:creatininase family protein [Pirellulaceae bacterium]